MTSTATDVDRETADQISEPIPCDLTDDGDPCAQPAEWWARFTCSCPVDEVGLLCTPHADLYARASAMLCVDCMQSAQLASKEPLR